MNIFTTSKKRIAQDTIKFQYKTVGTCSKLIDLTIVDGVLESVVFTGGCDGNLKGIALLVKGLSPKEVINKLEGITCRSKPTSCPDQLVQALKQMGY